MACFIYTLIISLSVFSTCMCIPDLSVVFDTLRRITSDVNSLKSDVNEVRNDVSSLDTGITSQIRFENAALRSELQQQVTKQVRETMEDILQGQSLEQIFRSNIFSKMKRLEQGHNHLKRNLDNLMKTLSDVQKEKDMYRETLLKVQRNVSNLTTGCIAQNNLLWGVLKKSDTLERTSDRENRLDRNQEGALTSVLEKLNLTCEPQSSKNLTTQVSSTTPTSVTVPPTQRKNRLIITSLRSRELSQLNLHSNMMSKFRFPKFNEVSSLCYVDSIKRILVGVRVPDKIVSVTLKGKKRVVLKEGVRTYGMGVDEGRETIFLTTWEPKFTISKMSVKGEDYTVITDLYGYSDPAAIAVNSEGRELYVCTGTKLIRVSYSGDVVDILAAGTSIIGVTFDSVRNFLYFTKGTKLMKISVPNNVTSEVITVAKRLHSLSYYNNTVYYGGAAHTRYVGAVQLGEKVVDTKLQTMSSKYNYQLFICLVP